MLRCCALAFLITLAPLPGVAMIWECDTTSSGRGGWIPPKIFVEVDRDATKASAVDGYIKEVHGKPIPVKIKRLSGEKVQLDWRLKGVKTSNSGTTTLSHTFILDRAARSFRMRGNLHGGDNIISGRGTCKTR